MARIVNPAGVPNSPVIDGGVTVNSGNLTVVGTGEVNNPAAHDIKALGGTSTNPDVSTTPSDANAWTHLEASNYYTYLESPSEGLIAGHDASYTADGQAFSAISTSAGGSSAGVSASSRALTAPGGGGAFAEINATAEAGGFSQIAIGAYDDTDFGKVIINGNVEATGSMQLNGRHIDPKRSMYLIDDFAQSITALAAMSSQTGDATAFTPTPVAGAIGLTGQRTGTGTTNRQTTGYLPGNGTYRVGHGYVLITEQRIKIPILSDGTQSFCVTIGMGTANDSNAPSTAQQATFHYKANNGGDSSISNQTYWQTLTRNSGLVTVNTGLVQVPVTTDWTVLKIVANAASTSFAFYVNDVLIATHTANIPPAGTAIQHFSTIEKVAGGTGREVWSDYFAVTCNFPTSR